MVLAEPVGKRRGFWRGFFFSIATAGVYSFYWNYKAHNELYRQFELASEGRDEGVIWYVLGLVLPPFLVGYVWVMAGNVAYLRTRLGLRPGISPAQFTLLVVVGFGGGSLALFLASVLPGPDSVAGALILVAIVLFFGTVPYAYARLQRDVNETWDAYHQRLAFLTAPAVAPAPPAPPSLPPLPPVDSPRPYYADLQGPAPLPPLPGDDPPPP